MIILSIFFCPNRTFWFICPKHPFGLGGWREWKWTVGPGNAQHHTSICEVRSWKDPWLAPSIDNSAESVARGATSDGSHRKGGAGREGWVTCSPWWRPGWDWSGVVGARCQSGWEEGRDWTPTQLQMVSITRCQYGRISSRESERQKVWRENVRGCQNEWAKNKCWKIDVSVLFKIMIKKIAIK